jgi:FkbM family methyltransferase
MTSLARSVASSELLDLALMVSGSCWGAKEYLPAKRAAQLALQIEPACVEALTRLGRVALVERDFVRAEEYFERAATAQGGFDATTAVNLAIAQGSRHRFGAALQMCDLALSLGPEFLPAHIHRAALNEEIGQIEEAERLVVDSLRRFPGHPELLYALALYQLKRGDFANGWLNYENRPPRLHLASKLEEYPEWAGEPLDGKTVLVCGEQGMGDQIMFARYIPLLEAIGAKVVFFTLPELARLFAGALLNCRVITGDAELAGIEPDYWVAAGSLPLKWRTIENIDVVRSPAQDPALFPYLWAPRAEIDRFGALISGTGNLRVGLCWKGNPKHRRDEYRSMPFAELKPLLEIPGIDFYSLQRGDTESGLIDLTAYCHDMADTAAAIANLDLVITVDTAVLHLAGAMGKPVWGLIYTPGDWRWGSAEARATPWYSSARLIRQRKQLVWGPEIGQLACDLWLRRCSIAGKENKVRRAYTDGKFTGFGNCKYGAMSWPGNDHYIGRALDLYGEYSESEMAMLRRVLAPGDTVVEAGANVGGLTVPIAQHVGIEGKVHAFEPQPAYFRCLTDNLLRNTVAVRAPMALGCAAGRMTLRRVEEAKVHAPGWASTGPEFTVGVTTVDALGLETCHLIKIDVDGAEHEILRGAEATIGRCRPFIYVEYDKPTEYPEMLAWLATKGYRLGYRLYRHAAPLFNPHNWWGNQVNVFGSLVSLMVLAVPAERKGIHPTEWGIERIQIDHEVL